jgi:hypothetical protein
LRDAGGTGCGIVFSGYLDDDAAPISSLSL